MFISTLTVCTFLLPICVACVHPILVQLQYLPAKNCHLVPSGKIPQFVLDTAFSTVMLDYVVHVRRHAADARTKGRFWWSPETKEGTSELNGVVFTDAHNFCAGTNVVMYFFLKVLEQECFNVLESAGFVSLYSGINADITHIRGKNPSNYQ